MNTQEIVNGMDKVADLKKLRSILPESEYPVVDQRIAVVSQKPALLHKLNVSINGAWLPPKAAYLDKDGGTTYIDSVIKSLEQYKTDPRAKMYPKG